MTLSYTRINLILVCAICVSTVFMQACDSGNPVGDVGSNQPNTTSETVASLTLDVSIEGSLTPDSPVSISYKAFSPVNTEAFETVIQIPELRLVERGADSDGVYKIRTGEAIEPYLDVTRSAGRGEQVTGRTTVTFPVEGYYPVIVTVATNVLPSDVHDNLLDAILVTKWVYISKDGGLVTDDVDPSIFDDDVRVQLGPLSLISEPVNIQLDEPSTLSRAKLKSSSASIDRNAYYKVWYYNAVFRDYMPVRNAKAEWEVYDGYERRAVYGQQTTTDNLGRFVGECYDSGFDSPTYEKRARVYAVGGDVGVNSGGDSPTLLASHRNPACGVETLVNLGPYKQAHLFDTAQRTVRASRSFFGAQRPPLTIIVTLPGEGNQYKRALDRVYIDTNGMRDIGTQSGDLVFMHEYGHALHEKGLGGIPGSGIINSCGSSHRLRSVENLDCAYKEGFADYHGAVIQEKVYREDYGINLISSSFSRVSEFERNDFYPGDPNDSASNGTNGGDGSVVEGAVAAFLYDMTDPANEIHDAVSFPGYYISNTMLQCRIRVGNSSVKPRAIDDLIACFRESSPNYSSYFPERAGQGTFVIQTAARPPGWSGSAIDALWLKNLYSAPGWSGPPGV